MCAADKRLSLIALLAACLGITRCSVGGADVLVVKDLGAPMADGGNAGDLSPEARIIWRTDTTTIMPTRVMWDTYTEAVCQRQPLCVDCKSPDWSVNPMHCVPDPRPFEGKPTAVSNFFGGFGDMFLDPDCTKQPVYGLRLEYWRKGATPRWAYDFREYRRTAQVYEVKVLQSPDWIYRGEPGSCELMTQQQIDSQKLQWQLFGAVRLTEAWEWAPWERAKQELGL